MNKPFVRLEDKNLIDYKIAWERQTELHQALVQQKRQNPEDTSIPSTLMVCQHPPVYTLGKSGKEDNLIWNEDERAEQGITFYKINRGGDVTYHGPGQLVVYPIFDLDQFFRDVHRYVRSLEEVVIRTMADFGITTQRVKGFTGVWIESDHGYKKICAIGVHLSRWVSMHGIALNVSPDLNHFHGIVPCGISDENKSVTSMQNELLRKVEVNEVKPVLLSHFRDIFNYEIVDDEF